MSHRSAGIGRGRALIIVRVAIVRDRQQFLPVSYLAQLDLPTDLVRSHHDGKDVDTIVRERSLGALAHTVSLGHDVLLAGRYDVPPVWVHPDGKDARILSAKAAGVEQPKARVVHHCLRFRRPAVLVGREAVMRLHQVEPGLVRLERIANLAGEGKAL
uniref:Uncharacterized protein n=1 Tax=Anopheles farauti TaxID=69004 RepID=A0A182QA75_9DIPT